MKNTYLSVFSLLVLSAVSINSCKHKPNELVTPDSDVNDTTVITPNPPSNCDSNRVYFKNTILPILTSNCAMAGCHSAADDKKMYDFNHVQKYLQGGLNSDLFKAITTNDPGDRMPRPPANKLDTGTIGLIKKWIMQGTRNDSCTTGCDSSKYAYASDISPIIVTNCGGKNNSCHFAGGATVNIGTYDELKTMSNNNKLINSIKHIGNYPMPSAYLKLSSCDINKIQKWINAGYPK